MHFEFDSEGYVSCILYGCITGSCIEYNGLVPSEPEEYADMDDWADNAKVQAYYLNEKGNLTYDANRAAALCPEDEVVFNKYTNDQIKSMGIFDAIYPVGSLYISVNDVNPAYLFGGTWEQVQDKFLLSAGSTYSAGDTGGQASHSFSASHKHIAPVGSTATAYGLVSVNGTVSGGSGKAYQTGDIQYSGALSSNVTLGYTTDATVSATIPTMPPYLVVYVWQRVEDPIPENYENFIDANGETFIDANAEEFMVEVS